MIDDGQLRIWAAEAKEARESALWEYCPKEFWLLLTEIAELKRSDVESQIRLEQGDRIHELEAEVDRLQSRERHHEEELRRMLGTMVQVKERLQIMLAENAALSAKLLSYRKVMHPLPELEDWPPEE